MLDVYELSTLAAVSARIGPLKTQQVVDLSHKEKAWLDNVAGHALIDYSFAFELIDNSAGYSGITV